MIPIRRIADFLNKKTTNYELATSERDRLFTKFISRIQMYRPNKNIYRWNDLTIRNPRIYGYTLQSTMISADNRMATWKLTDVYERVSITLSCSDDAGQITGWQARRDGLKKEKEAYPTWSIQATDDPQYLTITASNKENDPSTILYYK